MAGLLLLFSFLLTIVGGRPRDKTLRIEEVKQFCRYEGKEYMAGARFEPGPCTRCVCPRFGGRARCAIEDCRAVPHCLQWKANDTSCCQTCLHFGCLHSDGSVHRPGADVPLRTPCERCVCPEGGGRTLCETTACPRLACVDAQPPTDQQCCATCPNGPNCWHENQILQAGVVMHDGKRKCQCPDGERPYWLDPAKVEATCTFEDMVEDNEDSAELMNSEETSLLNGLIQEVQEAPGGDGYDVDEYIEDNASQKLM